MQFHKINTFTRENKMDNRKIQKLKEPYCALLLRDGSELERLRLFGRLRFRSLALEESDSSEEESDSESELTDIELDESLSELEDSEFESDLE